MIARAHRRSGLACAIAAALAFVCLLPHARGQITQLTEMTTPPTPGAGHAYINLLAETVDPATGQVNVHINIPTPKGRGISLPFSINYNSGTVNALQPVTGAPWDSNWVDGNGGSTFDQGGWSYSVPWATASQWSKLIDNGSVTCYYSDGYIFKDPNGASHPLGLATMTQEGSGAQPCVNANFYASSGGDAAVTANWTAGSSCTWNCQPNAQPPFMVTDANGTNYFFPGAVTGGGALPYLIEDRNGNQITNTFTPGTGVFTFTDTLGRAVVSSNGFGPAGHTNTITTPEGSYSITWATASGNYPVPSTPISGNDYCSSPIPVNSTRTVISSITLPDGEQYQFQYKDPYGLLSEIIYPDGGTVTYTWEMSVKNQEMITESPSDGGGTCYLAYSVPVLSQRTVSFTGSGTNLTQTFELDTTFPPYNIAGWTARTASVSTADPLLGTKEDGIYIRSCSPATAEYLLYASHP